MNLNLINGIGVKYIELLNKLNINCIEDLLTYYPYRYNIYRLGNLIDDGSVINVKAVVESIPRVGYIRRNLNKLDFRCLIDEKLVNVIIFNRAFLKDKITVGREIVVVGKYDSKRNSLIANDILFDKINGTKVEAVYHLVNGLTNKQINNFMRRALGYSSYVNDDIPNYLVDKYNFMNKSNALKNIHIPSSFELLKQAKLRLIYEEFFMFLFKINYLKYKYERNSEGIKRDVDFEKVREFISKLGFELTRDQVSAVNDVYNDLTSGKRMNRLILGDVGSGKTIVSIIGLFINYLSGMQGAMMAPTEILACQHYEQVNKLFSVYGIKVGLLVGSLKKREKAKVIEQLKNGELDVVVGTHALLNEEVVFANLGLVITDEQHRFGVNQRGNLQNKGHLCDVLYMSATPIPRTYALTIYGDMDTTMIKTKPSGRKEIITLVKKEKELREVLSKCLECIKDGHQIYVVAPLIEGDEESELNDVYLLKEKFEMAFQNKVSVGILHGKMKNKEKDEIMEDYKEGKIKILISTTVIEVGIDVKNSTMMIIFNAERFGLATLHQLRGRVGRNDLQSYCYLICNKDIERLKVMESSNDGFYISEKDFEMRGQGDLFGVRQSGDMAFKIGDIRRDYRIMMQAKEDVVKFIEMNVNDNFDKYKIYQNIVKFMSFVD